VDEALLHHKVLQIRVSFDVAGDIWALRDDLETLIADIGERAGDQVRGDASYARI